MLEDTIFKVMSENCFEFGIMLSQTIILRVRAQNKGILAIHTHGGLRN